MRFGQGGNSSSSRGGAAASGSPLSCRLAAAADTAAAAAAADAGLVQRLGLSPVRTRLGQSPRAYGRAADQVGSSTAATTGVGVSVSAFGSGSARRSLAFQAAAGGSAAAGGAEDSRGPRSQGTTTYTSPRAPAAVSRTTAGAGAGAAAAAGEADRYKQLVREADAALQQLAACRHKADSGGAPASPVATAAAAAGGPYSNRLHTQGQSVTYSPGKLCGQGTAAFSAVKGPSAVLKAPASHTTHQVRPHSASLASTIKFNRGLSEGDQGSGSEGGVCGGNRPAAAGGRVGASHLRASCSPSFSRQLLAGCQPGSGLGGSALPAKTSPAWSPSRHRLGSPGQATAAAAMTVGLQGELQALDQDIAAAEASLQAAVIRLGAAAGPP
jgi:hypothetical protein